MNLIYDLFSANEAGELRNATVVMADLGITYERAIPQSLYDCWQFFGCENVPNPLPTFLREFKSGQECER